MQEDSYNRPINQAAPCLTTDWETDVLRIGIITRADRIDSIDYRLHYKWAITFRHREVKVETDVSYRETYNHLEDIKTSINNYRRAIQNVFIYKSD